MSTREHEIHSTLHTFVLVSLQRLEHSGMFLALVRVRPLDCEDLQRLIRAGLKTLRVNETRDALLFEMVFWSEALRPTPDAGETIRTQLLHDVQQIRDNCEHVLRKYQ
jgi:hypothetical protein